MDNKNMKNAFEKLKATDEQIDTMWENIEWDMIHEKEQKNKNIPITKYILRVAVLAIVIVSSGIGIDAAAGGKLLSKVKDTLLISQRNQSVVSVTENMQQRGIDVYAPDIEYIDGTYVIFGNQRGITVYNHERGVLAGNIDTQEIGCIYFNSNEYMSHIVKVENELIIFNSKNQIPYGSYYRYIIEDTGTEYPVMQSGNDKKELEEYFKLWEIRQKDYTDTFEVFSEVALLNNYVSEKNGAYSERSIQWRNEEGTKLISYLTVDEEGYAINTYNKNKELLDKAVLILESSETEEVMLPAFVYTGTDKAIQAIWDYHHDDVIASMEMGEVLVPAFIIVKKIEKADELLVFGNFWTYGFVLNGNMLEESSGGENIACFHLKETENGYEVINVEEAQDGSDYAESIKAFTKGYPGVYLKLMNGNVGREDAIREYLRMYVESNRLDIQYYKEYGWDPVKIF